MTQTNVNIPDRYLLYEMPYQAHFYGRQVELETLETWILKQKCHFVLITGMGGQGKTALATYFCQQVALSNQFDKIIWQSLINAPTLPQVTARLLRFFLKQTPYQFPNDFPAQLFMLFEFFKEQKCLLLFDNVESILDASGYGYKIGYEDYGNFLLQFGQSQIHSCLLLTSRETPPEVPRLLHTTARVKTLSLMGIDEVASQQLLAVRGITLIDEQIKELDNRYSGNPLALSLIADTIQVNFQGDTSTYLAHHDAIFNQIQDLLKQQIARLSSVAEGILIWLAIEREAIMQQTLQANIFDLKGHQEFITALSLLKQRTLLQISPNGFSLQNVVMEYLSDWLINQVCQEIITGQPNYLERFALMKAQGKDYIRQSQIRIFLHNILERLMSQLGLAGVERQLRTMITQLQMQPTRRGYTGGNLLNLLVHLEVDLGGLDLSNITIWQAYLQDTALPNINFAGADLTGSVFMNALFQTMGIAYCPSGQQLATVHSQGDVNIWQVDDLTIIKTFKRGASKEYAVTFSPDGRWLAANGEDHVIYVWDYQVDTTQYILADHLSEVTFLAFSPDSQLLASASLDKTVRLWDMRTGNQVVLLDGHDAWVYAVAFTPDGKWLISTGVDGKILVWSVETNARLQVLQGHERILYGISVSPDGKWLATAGTDGVIKLWALPALDLQHTLLGHEELVLALTFHPDSHTLASLSTDGTIRLWNVETGQLIHTLFTNTRDAYGLAFHPDGTRLATCDETFPVRLWDVQMGEAIYSTKSSRQNETYQLLYSPDDLFLVTAHINSDIRLWNLTQTPITSTLYRTESNAPTRYLALSEDGNTLACTYGPNIQVWAFPEMHLRNTLTTPAKRLISIALSPDVHRVAVSTNDHLIRMVDMDKPKLDMLLEGHTSAIPYLVYSTDGSLLASSSYDNTTRLWDTTTGVCLHTIQMPGETVYDVCFSPDGQFLISGYAHTLYIWDLQAGKQVRQFTPHPAQDLRCPLAVNKAGTIVASIAQDHSIILWDLQQGQILRELVGIKMHIATLAISSDGTTLVAASTDELIRLWDVETGECVSTLEAEVPYEGMNISGAIGLAPSTQAALKQLGAIG